MKRKIVLIDEKKCTGCGLCVDACHEGALQLVDGKARLMSESYCDGLGNCLPECPAGAITIEDRDADVFDDQAVKKHRETAKAATTESPGPEKSCVCGCGEAEGGTTPEDLPEKLACGCPGTSARLIERGECAHGASALHQSTAPESQLRQWPCQIKLVPVNATYLDNANLLVAADCTAYAYPNVHNDFMRHRITLIGCPKLDDTDYTEKMTDILKAHEIRSIKVLRMEVPCCGGIVDAVKQAVINSGKMIPWGVVTVGANGRIVEDL
jgi:NAD-dependent dihydropyrimidine dehydrogenase PreA subunit